jgi:hypothetical protein
MFCADGDSGPTARRWLARTYGLYVVCGSVVIGLLSWLALHLLAPIVEEKASGAEIPPLVLQCVAHRGWMPLLALPALLCGIALLRVRHRALGFVLLGTAALLLPFVIILYCFIMLLAQLYTYQPL